MLTILAARISAIDWLCARRSEQVVDRRLWVVDCCLSLLPSVFIQSTIINPQSSIHHPQQYASDDLLRARRWAMLFSPIKPRAGVLWLHPTLVFAVRNHSKLAQARAFARLVAGAQVQTRRLYGLAQARNHAFNPTQPRPYHLPTPSRHRLAMSS